ncbi:MAG: isoleucine--tRNA ligase [Bacteroidetes Order II. Incertae sedis bacterium]|jgi:isoleucyl-tRNA synthetase|nr:isoleucine--tRNA ligase [Bacteroidetes Order II. bacterium]MBT4602762.1 isoleucine--tRNA ligase [Bacteroidetes Order II. bacterium]MBT7401131.1 isoleucine--tRNA ligase [Bacteroidetes Order II. bacterium]
MAFKEHKDLSPNQMERDVLQFWTEHDIFGQSVRQHEGQETFSFYEGPPTANGKPGIHHVMSRTIKDTFCRFKTMKGFQVARKAGWDTHGLPVEIEVEKALGLEGRHQVEEYGIAKYNAACRESVLKYKGLWDELTTRMGYWVNLDDPYITFKSSYIESVWWLLNEIYKKDLLYKGFKIQWYSPGSGTVLSSHEVSLGYKEVQDPSIYTRFRASEDQNLYYLAWTTTPWTTISNVALAVGSRISYVRIRLTTEDIGEHDMILAEKRLSVIKEDYEIIDTMTGADLLGRTYEPLFSYFEGEEGAEKAWRVVAADYVSTEDGTGIVHTAPAFGAEDHETAKKEDLPMFNAVKPDGHFRDEFGIVAGLWFKDADKVATRDLRDRGLMYRHETYLHNYPHDWRKGTPLMSYPVESWFIKTTAVKERLIELNKQINWQPKGIGTGRFGDWLENNVDWALSRRRYWGTPLPIWQSDAPDSEYIEVIGSIADLRAKCGDQLPENNDDIDLHRPFVDNLTWPAPDGGTMRRVEDLIDVWFDSGAMPFAQWHYPFENKEIFEKTYPGDFIAEGVDQTRGWFYTLHAIGTLVMDNYAYRNVVVNGLVLDEKGEKMSKSKGNAADPFELINKYGVDAIRWYMMSNTPPWENLKFSERGIVETQRKFFNTLSNVYSFFATYANVDGYSSASHIAIEDRPEMDRWIMSRLASTAAEVHEALEEYHPTRAARAIEAFSDELSNWYIRRNRRRFWSAKDAGSSDGDKSAAYQTVVECLLTVSRLMAPIAPFYSDWMFRNVNSVVKSFPVESVHLTSFPSEEERTANIDRALEHKMYLARTISSIVLGLRNTASINVRQPLPRILTVTGANVESNVIDQVAAIIREETNIKSIEYVEGSSDVVKRQAKANFKALGRRLGKLMKPVSQAIRNLTPEDIDLFLSQGKIEIDAGSEMVTLTGDDLEIVSEGIEGWLVGQEGGVTVALDTQISPELQAEGYARETVNRIQNMRKEANYEVTDRIAVQFNGSDSILSAINFHAESIRNETLCLELQRASRPGGDLVADFEINSENLTISIQKKND